MCMHINMQTIVSQVEQMNVEELDRVQEAIDRRRQQLGHKPVSSVVERRNYGNGILQLESRAYRRKDGGLTDRGPYWYFHYRQGGKQRTLYIGKTDNPESVVDEKLGEQPTKGDRERARRSCRRKHLSMMASAMQFRGSDARDYVVRPLPENPDRPRPGPGGPPGGGPSPRG